MTNLQYAVPPCLLLNSPSTANTSRNLNRNLDLNLNRHLKWHFKTPSLTRRTGVLWSVMRELERVNKELWLVLSLFVVALIFNVIIASQQMVLGFYTLPTVLSAYLYGRRHATLTAGRQRAAGHHPHLLEPPLCSPRWEPCTWGRDGWTSPCGAGR